MKMKHGVNIQNELVRLKGSFPENLRLEIEEVLNSITIHSKHEAHWGYLVVLKGCGIEIPSRIYWEEHRLMKSKEMNQMQKEILACILTRHHNGYVREKYLKQIINSTNYWAMPFLVQLLGEYVVELLDLIWNEFSSINSKNLRDFILENENYWYKTKQRIASYWDCYYRFRDYQKDRYIGYRLIERIEELI